jgi:hypothetical protein
MIALEVNKNALEALQRLALYPDPLPEFEERPRLGVKSRRHNGLNSRDLAVFDGYRNFSATHDGNDTRCHKNR